MSTDLTRTDPDVIATMVYPMENRIRVKTNPARHLWFPLALNDELLLQAFVWVSALHHSLATKTSEPPELPYLTKSIIELVNTRLKEGNLSVTTIGAVSCLTLSERWRGNMSMAELHLKGLAGVFRQRQLSSPVPSEYITKIWKADIVHNGDILRKPFLPRPPPTSRISGNVLNWELASSTATTCILRANNISSALISIFWTIRRLCWMVEDLWQRNAVLNADEFGYDVTCIQHDLLTIDTTSCLDEAVKIALLCFTKPLNRLRPFDYAASIHPSRQLRQNLEHVAGAAIDINLNLWLYFIGALASQETPDQPWFVTNLTSLLEQNDCGFEWHAIKPHLESVAWTSVFHDHLCLYLCSKLSEHMFVLPAT